MIIFGWGRGRTKDLGEVAPAKCPNCLHDISYRHISSTRWLSLFFIPLIPYSTQHLLLCPVCTRGPKLDAAQREAVIGMQQTTASWRARQLSDDAYSTQVGYFWQAFSGSPLANPALPMDPPSLPPPP